MPLHDDYIYSITIHSDELSLISSMRGLSEYCQFDGNKRIAWGNTKEKDWASAGHRVTFHFSRANYRDNFIHEAKNLFRENLWRIESQSDNNPAEPAN